jgi:hypothetical protein
MTRRGPLPSRITFLSSLGTMEESPGHTSSHALGIIPHGVGFASVMLLPGMILEDGFATLAQAHAFNEEILAARNMLVGAISLDEFFEKAGGREEAQAIVAQCKKKVTAK